MEGHETIEEELIVGSFLRTRSIDLKDARDLVGSNLYDVLPSSYYTVLVK